MMKSFYLLSSLVPANPKPNIWQFPFVFGSIWLCAHRVIPADFMQMSSVTFAYILYIYKTKKQTLTWKPRFLVGDDISLERIPPYL